jgi:hypothetical protein
MENSNILAFIQVILTQIILVLAKPKGANFQVAFN